MGKDDKKERKEFSNTHSEKESEHSILNMIDEREDSSEYKQDSVLRTYQLFQEKIPYFSEMINNLLWKSNDPQILADADNVIRVATYLSSKLVLKNKDKCSFPVYHKPGLEKMVLSPKDVVDSLAKLNKSEPIIYQRLTDYIYSINRSKNMHLWSASAFISEVITAAYNSKRCDLLEKMIGQQLSADKEKEEMKEKVYSEASIILAEENERICKKLELQKSEIDFLKRIYSK